MCKRLQMQVFESHIELAVTHSLPLNVHSRGAGHHAISAVQRKAKELKASNVVALFHAFDGN